MRARVLAVWLLTGLLLGLFVLADRLTNPALHQLNVVPVAGGLAAVAGSIVMLRARGSVSASATVAFLAAAILFPLDAIQWGGFRSSGLAAVISLPLLASFIVSATGTLTIATSVSIGLIAVEFTTAGRPPPAGLDSPLTLAVNSVLGVLLLWALTLFAVVNQRERERMGARLAEREALYAAAIAADHAGVFEWRPDVGFSTRSSRLDEMLGLGHSFLDAGAGALQESLRDTPPDARNTLELPRPRADGTIEWFRIDLLGVRTSSGPGVVGVVRDVTEAKRAAQLKDEFFAVVSHELRSPLTSIYGALGLLRAGATAMLRATEPRTTEELVNIAYSNSIRLLRLVDDLLDVQRLDAGGLAFDHERVELSAAVREVLEAQEGYAASCNAAFELHDESGAACVVVDRRRLEQVLTNLVTNACKWTAPGTSVVVTVREESGRGVVTVLDHGPGVAESFREQVFGRFTQAAGGPDRPRGGTGLGLYIARGFTEKMGGKIGLRSRPNAGAEFWVEFPISR